MEFENISNFHMSIMNNILSFTWNSRIFIP